MKWTSEKPSVPGWYWWRDNIVRVVYIGEYPPGNLYIMGYHNLRVAKGEWAGPLTEPEEETK